MTIPTLPFGRTGHISTRIIFGAAAFWSLPQEEADQMLDVLLKYGINHIDTAAGYNDSELHLGPWMPKYRDRFFLATKTGERTYDGAKAQFEQSLKRLQVDSVDLIQIHHLVGEEEWEIALGPGGVLEYLQQAREQGLVRFIGVTGHEVAIAQRHLQSLERFDFDSVLLPYNYVMMQNPTYAAGFNEILRLAQERHFAVQTIKGICRRPWAGEHTHNTWYEPLTTQASIDKAVHWVLGQAGIFLNTAADIHLLPMILDAASRFEARPSDEEMQAEMAALEMAPLFT